MTCRGKSHIVVPAASSAARRNRTAFGFGMVCGWIFGAQPDQGELEVPADLGRLPRELELVIFRVVQESLTNIHRHSGSASAKIHLEASSEDLWCNFKSADRGKGISTGGKVSGHDHGEGRRGSAWDGRTRSPVRRHAGDFFEPYGNKSDRKNPAEA